MLLGWQRFPSHPCSSCLLTNLPAIVENSPWFLVLFFVWLFSVWFGFVQFSFGVLEIGSHCVALAGLKVFMENQACLELTDPPACPSRVLGLKANEPPCSVYLRILKQSLRPGFPHSPLQNQNATSSLDPRGSLQVVVL